MLSPNYENITHNKKRILPNLKLIDFIS